MDVRKVDIDPLSEKMGIKIRNAIQGHYHATFHQKVDVEGKNYDSFSVHVLYSINNNDKQIIKVFCMLADDLRSGKKNLKEAIESIILDIASNPLLKDNDSCYVLLQAIH